MTKQFDLIIIGAGAAGMMCAALAGQKGHSVLLLDHAKRIGEKIRISGGGRCNFTNTHVDGYDASLYYVSENPRFVRYALSNYTAHDFTALVEKHGISYHEKHKGQLFCNQSARDIITMLQNECDIGEVTWKTECVINEIIDYNSYFLVATSLGDFQAKKLVIATGGLAIPKIGATGFGYEVAKQFGHTVIPPRPALVPLQFENWEKKGFNTLSGVSLPVSVSTSWKKKQTIHFTEDLLFRHRGLSGPAILQISSYWQPGSTITINLSPNIDLSHALCSQKKGTKIQLDTALFELAPHLPKRLVEHWLSQDFIKSYAKHRWADIADHLLIELGNSFNQWQLLPSGTDGHRVAEASRGGVNTREINPRTMESNLRKNLYFIGEVVDVVGWLGGYNFQWAWASAVCATNAFRNDKS